MISAKLYDTLPAAERKLWHSHAFEVKSGMLIMPGPNGLPTSVWEEAETSEMKDVVGLYGKTYHFWQVDKGDKLPLGEPQLMMSFTEQEQFPEFAKVVGERDERFGISHEQKAKKREGIQVPEVHGGELRKREVMCGLTTTKRSCTDADSMWKGSSEEGGAKKQESAGVNPSGAQILKGEHILAKSKRLLLMFLQTPTHRPKLYSHPYILLLCALPSP